MKRAIVILSLCVFALPAAMAATIDGETVILLDTSGSGAGKGVVTPTDQEGLRVEVTRSLLEAPWLDTGGKTPAVAVITCNEKPEILLNPTTDQRLIARFAKDLRITSSGATSIDSTLALLTTLKGTPANIIYIGDGLLTRPRVASAQLVADLPAALIKMYGSSPQLHVIAVDSSGKVFEKTKSQWVTIAAERVAEVAGPADVQAAVETTARNLGWHHPVVPERPLPSMHNGYHRTFIAGSVAVLLGLVLIKLRARRSRLNAFVTVDEDGRSRRTSAGAFRKAAVSIGDGNCDIKVPKWEKPITLTEREVVDRHGRKRRQTVARQGNRSVTVGALPVSFSNGKSIVKIRGGRR